MGLLQYAEPTLHRTVQVICSLLAVEPHVGQSRVTDEAHYRAELVACMLTSRVSASSAEAAMNRLTEAGLLANSRWRSNDERFESDVATCLRASSPRIGSYRFPNAKAAQISKLRFVLKERSLSSLLNGGGDAKSIRRELVQSLPGVGPKQASMFLRNVGATFSLAILDAHVLKFLSAVGMIDDSKTPVATLRQYEQVEDAAILYARTCGQDVGYLDWAIWITMKAITEMRK